MALKISKELLKEDKWKIKLNGEMDIDTYLNVKDEINSMIEEEILDIEIDFTSLSYIDSTGIGVLIGILKKLKKFDKQLFIINAEQNIKRLFTITGLDKIFIIK